jgi:hypothetical protein
MGKITDDDPVVAKNALSDMMRAKSAEMKDARDIVAEELKEAQKLLSQASEKEHGGFNHQRYIQDIESKIAKTQKKNYPKLKPFMMRKKRNFGKYKLLILKLWIEIEKL